MEQRCTAMATEWIVPKFCSDFESFLKVTNCHILRSERAFYQHAVDEYQQAVDEYHQGVKNKYKSALSALDSFLRLKFNILAPRVSLFLRAEMFNIHIHVLHDDKTNDDQNQAAPLTFYLRSISFDFHMINPMFGTAWIRTKHSAQVESKVSDIDESLFIFQDMELEIESATWLPSEGANIPTQWPTFVDGAPCGLLYM
eukprot:13922040-Ditylum_brightwellii.AAC.1